jgi:hypothetical protein
MVATAAITAVSMMKMNQAARFAACGEGWVIPMVLMKAFATNRMNFMVLRCWSDPDGSRNLQAWYVVEPFESKTLRHTSTK